MVPAFHMSCNEMMNKWEKLLTNESSCEVDVWPYLQSMSNDVISRTAFGSSYEEGRKISELQLEMLELIIKSAQSAYILGSRCVCFQTMCVLMFWSRFFRNKYDIVGFCQQNATRE